jgi:Na+-driven multidrug efflux pump
MQAFVTALFRPIVFLIPTLLILSPAFELHGVYLSLPVTDVLTFTLLIVFISPVIRNIRRAAALEQKVALA